MTTDLLKPKSRGALQIVVDLCASGVILLAGVALLGWLSGARALASVLVDYIPMAVSTAVSFVVLASLLLGRRHPWAIQHNSFLAAITALLAVFHFINLLSYSISNGSLTVDTLLFSTNEVVQSFPVNRMSPITGATFLVSALALYFLFRSQVRSNTAHGAALLGFIVFIVGSISMIGYLYGTPLLYSGSIIPIALTTALAFTFLSIGLIAAAGADNFILRVFNGPLLRARLLRTFLPISVLVILAQGYFHWRFIPGGINPALWDAWMSLVFAALMVVAIDLTSRVVAQATDRAQVERQQAEDSLRESEARYRVLVDASPDSIVLSDLTGRILRCNPQTFRTIGYERESDLIGKRIVDLVIPEDRERAIQNFRAAIHASVGQNNEYVGVKLDGRQFSIEVRSATIADSSGQPSSIISIIRDTTKRKQAEQEARKISQKDEEALRIARMGHWEFDVLTSQFAFNDQYYTLHGTTAKEAGGYLMSAEKFTSRYVHPSDAHLVGEAIQQAIETNDPNFQFRTEARILRADGEPRDVTVWFRVEKDTQGRTTKMLGVNQDITERKRTEDAMRESEDRYRDLVENSQDLICTHDMEGKLLTINPTAVRLLGYDLKELIGSNIRDYLVPETQGLFTDYLRQIKQHGAASGLLLMQTKGGERRIWEYNNTMRTERMAEPIVRGMARDITERKRAEQEAQQRDAILNAIAFSAERLLKGTDIESGIADVLERLGTATHSSRVYIFECEAQRAGNDDVFVTQRYEWAAPGITAQIDNPEMTNFPLGKMGFGRWIDQFSHDHPIHGYVDEMSEGEQAVLSSQDILSIAAMPIFVNQTWWGFIGVDECLRRRRWSVAELEALRVAAGTLGAAIQRQKAERDLQTQHDFARQILNNMGQGLTVTDSDRHFVYVNPAYAQMVGRTPEELLGKAPRDFTAQEDHATLDQARIRREQGETDTYETRLIHLDGREIPVTITGVPRWRNGSVDGTIAVVTDLTERKHAEQDLRESQAQLEGIFSSTMDAIITIEDDQRIVIFNPAAEQMFKCRASEVIGQTLDRFIPEQVRQEHRSYIHAFGKSDSTKRTMKTPTLALTCLRANGKSFPGEISISHLVVGGRNLYTAIIRDITERKESEFALQQAEAKYRNIFENAMEGIYQTTPEGKFYTANPALARMLGYESSEELITSVNDLNHGFYVQPGRREEFKRHLNDYGFIFQFESEVYGKDGNTIWISENVQTIRDERWHVHHYEGTLIDITERKRSEEALQRQTKELIAIYETARRLQQLRVPDILAREIMLSLERILNYTFGTVLLIEETTGRLLPYAISEEKRGGSFTDIDVEFIASHEPRVGKGITGWVAQSGEAVCVGNVNKDPRYYAVRQDIQSELCVPLLVNDQIIGVVNVESIRQNAYGESDQRVLETIAAQIATAIQNSRLYDQAQQEIAERKKVEDALRENQSRLQLIMDHMPVACILNDADTRVIHWNKAAEKIFGYTAEEMLGKVPDFLITPSSRDYVDAIYRRLVTDGTNAHNENENITKDGRTIVCEWINAPIQDEEGNFIGFLAMAQDVTERKKAEEQLRKLSLAVEQSPVSIVITNTRGEIEYANPTFKDVTGYSADEIIGQNTRILKSGHTSDDEYKTLWQTITHGGQWHGKFLNKKKNGELYWESASISPIVNESGKVTHYLAVKEDITEREHREHELEAIAAISLALRAAPTRKEMLPIIIDQLHSLLHSDSEAISMRDPLTDELVVELGRGTFATAAGVRMASDQGVSGLVIQSGKPYVSNDAQHDPNFVIKDILQGINAFACVPLSTHDTTLGILWIGRTTSIIASEVRVLVAIADIAANAMQRAALHEQTTKQVQRLTALRTIDNGISNSFDMRITLNIFIEQVLAHLNVHAASILISKDTLSLEYAAGSGFRNRGIAKSRLRVGESHAGRAALERRMISIPDLSKEPFAPFSVLAGDGFVSYYGVPLIAKGQLKGVLQIFHRAPLSPDEEWLDFLQTLAGQAAIAIDNAAMFDNLQRANSELLVAYNATIEGWSRALDLRDQETEGHTQRVTEMALNLATAMGVEGEELMHLQRGALLHDIGKMGVPDGILLKPGPLTKEEMEIMRRHPQYAYDMLSPIPFLRPALDIPYCHHEKWDGTGYPRKLKGEQIPLVARIFAVVDVWDAITSDRPYRAAWSQDKARDYIREQSGLYFEPRVVEMFLKMIETL